MKRDLRFYAELIIITIVVLITSDLWVDFILKFIHRTYPNNLTAIFIASAITTVAAIYGLYFLFGHHGNSSHSLRPPIVPIDTTHRGQLPPYEEEEE